MLCYYCEIGALRGHFQDQIVRCDVANEYLIICICQLYPGKNVPTVTYIVETWYFLFYQCENVYILLDHLLLTFTAYGFCDMYAKLDRHGILDHRVST